MSESEERSYSTIVIVGGGCYGTFYVRQLQRARDAGKIRYERIVVADRDPKCAAAQLGVEVNVAEWREFFANYLSACSTTSRDAIVPSPLMPHLMYAWLSDRAKERWPSRVVETRPLPRAPDVPWHNVAPDATSYASYATWTCPINCIEPRLCPHTRGDRSWTMPAAAASLIHGSASDAEALAGPVIFHCTHRAFGVGMFDTRDVVAADAFVASEAAQSPANVLVGTVSHCHGAFNVLHVGAVTK